MNLLLGVLLAALLRASGAVTCGNGTYQECDSCDGFCELNNGCKCYGGTGLTCLPSSCDFPSTCCPQGLFWHVDESCCSVEHACYPPCLDDEYCDVSVPECKCDLTKHPNTTLSSIVPIFTCEASVITLSVPKCLLEKLRYDPMLMHVRNTSTDCTDVYEDTVNNTRLISSQLLPLSGFCGNEVVKNTTHVVYSNILQIPPKTAGVVTVSNLTYHYSCAYSLDIHVNLTTGLNIISSTVNVPVGNTEGSASVTMGAFKDPTYTVPISAADTVPVGTTFYFGLVTDFQDANAFVLRADSCFSTPFNSPNATQRVNLVTGGCAAGQEVNVQVVENGVSLQVRFSAEAFAFEGYGQVFIFCNVRLCAKEAGNCDTCATGRSSERSELVGVGPYSLSDFYDTSSGSHTAVSWAVLGSSLLALLSLRGM